MDGRGLYRSAARMWYRQCMFASTSGVLRSRAIRAATLVTLVGLGGCKEQAQVERAGDGTILTPYLAIGETLSEDSVDSLGELGAAVVEATQPSSEQPGADEILAAAGRIASPDIATARLMYRKMSEGVIDWLAAHPDQREGLVLIHCPMTFNNEGAYWVQREGQLTNPYEGAMMLRCGAKIAWDDHRDGGPPAGDAPVEGMEAK